MQYMSFAPAGSVHSKASAIFYAQFCLLQIYQMLSEMQVPGWQKNTRAAALSHIHTLKSSHKITRSLCQIAAQPVRKNIRYDIICSFTVDLQ